MPSLAGNPKPFLTREFRKQSIGILITVNGGRRYSAENIRTTGDDFMKKIIAVLLTAVIAMSFFACGKKEGDLGKQTTVDKKNGYTLVEEVLTFKYNDDEEEIKKNPNAKTDGFVTNESNAVGKVNTKSAVLDIAKKEVGDKFNKINFAFDRTQGIWRVTFSRDTVSGEKTTSEKVMTVYVDEDGYTLATIKA